MIQLYYLAVPAREHRFDSVFQQLDVVATFFPIVSVPSLVAFVTRDKVIQQQNYLLIDLAEADWSNEHILSAVQTLRRFSVVKPVFLGPPGEQITILFKYLAEQNVDGLITDTGSPFDTLAAALQDDRGYLRRLSAIHQAVTEAANKEVSPLRIPPGLVIDAAVCGAMPRVGATTQAFALYHYLAQVGFQPGILDQGQPALKQLLELYRERAVEVDGCVEVNGIRIAQERTPAFNAYILDCGILTQGWVKSFCAADLSVLVGGVKPWELPALATACASARQGHPHELVTLVSFSTAEDMKAVGKYLGDCAAVPYHPDLWTPGSDTVYRAAVLPALMRICG